MWWPLLNELNHVDTQATWFFCIYFTRDHFIKGVFFHFIEFVRQKHIKGDFYMKNKRLVIGFGLLITALLAYAFIRSSQQSKPDSEQTPSSESSISQGASQEKSLKLGVLQLLSHPALDAIYQGLQDELDKEGFKDGENLTLDLQNAQGDQSNLATMSNKLVSDKSDIIVAITTPATLSLANVTKDIPIVMAGITYPVEAGLISSEAKPGNNITGVSDRTPIKQQLELMKEIVPNLSTIGILYTSSEDNSVKQAEEAQAFAKELGLEVKIATIANTNDIQQVSESLASQVQAIFIPIDNTIASAMSTVVKVTDQAKVPVFPSADTMVADGGVLGLGVDQYQIGVEAAKMVIAISKGANPADTPIVIANAGVIYLNQAKADQLGLVIPDTIKSKAQLVGPAANQ